MAAARRHLSDEDLVTCPECNGWGGTESDTTDCSNEHMTVGEACADCEGAGEVPFGRVREIAEETVDLYGVHDLWNGALYDNLPPPTSTPAEYRGA